MWFSNTGFLISSIVVLLSASVETTQGAENNLKERLQELEDHLKQITDPETWERYQEQARALTEAYRQAMLKLRASRETDGVDGETVYHEVDFEDATAGDGIGGLLGAPGEVIANSNLDNGALQQGLEYRTPGETTWYRNKPNSETHCIGFDYYLEPGAYVIQFLDVPGTIRLFANKPGIHRIDVYYDLSMQYAWPYLDGQLEVSLITDQDWSEPEPEAISVRLVGGQLAQFDNFVWKGGVDIFVSVYVPCE